MLYPYMLPMADFAANKCAALRSMVTADMLLIRASLLGPIAAAVHRRLETVKGTYPPAPGRLVDYMFVRYLCDYLKRVVAAGRLILARDDTYKQFASLINLQIIRAAAEEDLIHGGQRFGTSSWMGRRRLLLRYYGMEGFAMGR